MSTVLENSGGPGSSITLDPEIISIRDRYFIKKNDIQYSGFNAWRGIGKSKNTKIQFHLGSKSHVINYPINNELDQSFIGIVKNNKENKNYLCAANK